MKKLLVLAGLLSVAPAYADTIYGLYADANYWHTGSNYTTQTDATTRESFDNKASGQKMLNASFEHGIPLIPNARMRYTDLNATSKTNQNLETKANSTDIVAYYEILDNVVSVDLGVGIKRIDGNLNAANQTYVELSQVLPMAYASVGGKLPFTGLSAKAELGLAKNHKAAAQDALAEIKYNFVDKALVDVGVKAGYRVINVDYDKVRHPNFVPAENYPYQMNFKGPYVGVEVHF